MSGSAKLVITLVLTTLWAVPQTDAQAKRLWFPAFYESAESLAYTHGDALLQLARTALEAGAQGHELHRLPTVSTAAPFGIFVTVVKERKVRGCFGFMEPVGQSLEKMVAEAAYGAARLDVRHKPISPAEVGDMEIILSFVGPTQAVEHISAVDPKTMGLLVRADVRSAVLLPGEARTARWQVAETRRKANIAPHEPVHLFRFPTVTLYERDRPHLKQKATQLSDPPDGSPVGIELNKGTHQ